MSICSYFQLNNAMTFRSVGQNKNETSLSFNCCKEFVKFSLSPTTGAVEAKGGDENVSNSFTVTIVLFVFLI